MNPGPRNARLLDVWSLVHFLTGVGLAFLLRPWVAFGLMVLWEPLELLVLSPALMRWRGIRFGREALPNVLSDILVDGAGVLTGVLVAGLVGVEAPLLPLVAGLLL